jgi:hypothetical protein
MKDWNDATKWTDDDWKDLIAHPQPPDDPDENAEFEEWRYFENGKWITVRRKNPRYKKL